MAKVDANGRPDYPQPPVLDDRLAEKNAALADRLELMRKQDAHILAQFSSEEERIAEEKKAKTSK